MNQIESSSDCVKSKFDIQVSTLTQNVNKISFTYWNSSECHKLVLLFFFSSDPTVRISSTIQATQLILCYVHAHTIAATR